MSESSAETTESLAADSNAAVAAIVQKFPKNMSKVHKEFIRSLPFRISRIPASQRAIYIGRLQGMEDKCKTSEGRKYIMDSVQSWENEIEGKRKEEESKEAAFKLVVASWVQHYSVSCHCNAPRRRGVRFFGLV